MKKNLLLWIAMALLLPMAAYAQSREAEVGNWAATTTSASGAFHFTAKYSWTQMLYPQSEVGGAGYIHSIAFDNRSTAESTADSVKIYLGTSSMVTHPTSALTTWVPMTDLTLVYSATSFNVPAEEDELVVNLDVPYYYDGTNSLVVVISKANSVGTSSSTKFGYTSTTAAIKYTSGTNESYCRFPTVAGSNGTNKTNLRFHMTTAATESYCPAARNLRVGARTQNSIMIKWGAEPGEVFEVGYAELQEGAPEPTANSIVPTMVTDSSYTVSSLSVATMYRFFVRHTCDNSTFHEWQQIDVRTTSTPLFPPLSLDFEDTDGDASWDMLNTQNGWRIDSLEGNRKLFISNDGESNAYSVSGAAGVSWAWVEMDLTAGAYNVEFDWRASGELNYDLMRVFLVPSAVEFTTDWSLFGTTSALSARNVVPDGWLLVGSKSADSLYFNMRTGWQHFGDEVTVPMDGLYHLVFLWQNDGSGGTQPPAAIDNLTLDLASCPAPLAVDTVNIGTESADLTITHPTANTFLLIYHKAGSSRYDTLEIGSSYSMTGLAFGTTYEGRVYTLCSGDTSVGGTSFTFTTNCRSIAETDLPYVETFEAYGTGASMPISPCWTKGTNASSAYPYPNATNAINGTRSLYFYSLKNSSTPSSSYYSWAALPAVDETLTLSDMQLTFSARRYATTTNTYHSMILIGVAENVDSLTSAAALDTQVVWIDTIDLTSQPASSIHELEVSFAEYAGTGRHVVLYAPYVMGVTSGTHYNYIYIDDVTLGMIPSCFRPVAAECRANEAEEVELSWTPDERTLNPSMWQIEYGSLDFVAGEGIIETTSDTSIVISGLTPDSWYEFRITAVCPGQESDARVITFRTPCAPIVDLPYVETFESYSSGTSSPISSCWRKGVNGSTTQYPYPNTANAITGNISLYFYGNRPSATTTAPIDSWATLPLFDYPISSLSLAMKVRRYATTTDAYTSKLLVGVFDVPGDLSTFDTIQIIDLRTEAASSVHDVQVDFSQYVGNGKYIGLYCPVPELAGTATSVANHVYVDDVTVAETPSCNRPQGIAIATSDHESATLVISDTAQYHNYAVTLNNLDSVAADPIELTFTDTVYIITGLSPQTKYELLLITNCSDGTHTLPLNVLFRTACVPVPETSLPYVEDFETYSSGTSSPISPCWTKGAFGTTTQYPYPYSTNAITGGISLYGQGTSTIYSYAALPLFETPLDELQIGFYLRRYGTVTSSYCSGVYLGVMSNPNDITTFDTLEFFDMTPEDALAVRRFNVSLYGYEGTGTLAFLVPKAYGGATTNYIYIDSVVVDMLPNCIWPTQVEVVDRTASSVELSWVGSASNYQVQYSTSNTFSNPVNVSATGTGATITGLNDYTQYYFRVRSACGNDTSIWSSIVSARTFYDCGDGNLNILDTLGAGTSSAATSAFYCSTSYPRSFTSHIFTAQELNDMGLLVNNRINGISIRAGSTGGTISGAKVYMAETMLDAFGTPVANDTMDRSTMTLVYSGSIEVEANRWVDIPLNTPFQYSGNNNLMIILARDSAASAACTFYYNNTSPDYRTAYAYVTSSSTTFSSGTRSYSRPNMAFNVCTEVPTCLRPNAVVVGNMTDTSVTLVWDSVGTQYEILLNTSAVSPDSLSSFAGLINVTANDTTITIGGLTPSTDYYAFVRTLCGAVGNSEWSIMAPFRTQCAPQALPYIEDFELYGSGASNPIDPCWNKGSNNTTAYPYPNSTSAVNGNRSLYFYAYRPSSATATSYYSYAALPMFEDSVKNLSLSFYVRRHATITDSYTSRLVIGVMSNPNDISTFEPMDTLDLKDAPSASIHGYEYYFENYTGQGKYIAIYDEVPPLYGTSTTTSSYAYVDDVKVDRIPDCRRVVGVEVSAITATTATVEWDSILTAGVSYEVEYGPYGFEHGTGTVITSTTPTANLTGLTGGTRYDLYVRAHCTATEAGEWSFVKTFATECVAVALPLFMDFENEATGTAVPMPLCWTRWNNNMTASNGYYPYINSSTANAHSGSNYAYYFFSTSATYPSDQILATPAIDIATYPMNNNEVSFWAKRTTSEMSVVVGIMTDPTNGTTFTPIDTFALSDAYVEYTVPFTDYTGTGAYVAFRGTSTSSTYIFIDDISVRRQSPCPRAYDLTASNATATSVALGWSDTIGSTQWVVEYGLANDATTTTVTVNTNPYVLTGLTPNTLYRFRVAPMCSTGVQAEWSLQWKTFTTALNPATVPYSYDFEAAAEWSNWQTSSNHLTKWYRGLADSVVATNNVMYTSIDGGTTHSWLPRNIVNTFAYRDIDFGADTAGYAVSFRFRGGGCQAGNYDGVSVLLVDPAVPVSNSSETLATPWGRLTTVHARLENDWADRTVLFEGVSGVKRLVFVFFQSSTTASYVYDSLPPAVDDISVVLQECPRPNNLVVDDVTESTITLHWDGDDSATYVVDYRPAGTTGTDRFDTVRNATFHTITNIGASSTYNIWVRRVCSDSLVSYWSISTSATTLCGVATLPYAQDFETFEGTAYNAEGQPPLCWRVYSDGTSNAYIPHVTGSGSYHYPYSGSKVLTLTSGSGDTYGPTKVVALPPFVLPVSSLKMSFWYRMENVNYGTLTVGYVTDSTNLDASFVALQTITSSTTHEHDTVSFAAAPADAQLIAFRWYHDATFYSVGIDDIYVWSDLSAMCDAPIATLDSNVAETSLSVSWTSDASNFEVAIMEGSWSETAASPIAVTGTSYTFSGLTAGTTYAIGVRSVCYAGIQSDWTVLTATTLEHPCFVPTNVTISDVTFDAATIGWTPGENETSWQINVTGPSFDSTYTSTVNPITINGLASHETYTVKVRALCSATNVSDWSATVEFTTERCQPVSGVTATAVDSATATVTWNPSSNGSGSYEIEYGIAGFRQGNGTRVTLSATTTTLNNLDDNTTYDVYVRAYCTATLTSEWSSVVSFTTPQGQIGIEDVQFSDITLYPNPAHTTVTLSGVELGATVSVVDLNGRTLATYTAADTTLTIDVSDMAQGAYFVRISGQQQSLVRKLIVK